MDRTPTLHSDQPSEHTHLTFGVHLYHVNMGGMYYACHMMLSWPEFIAEETTGLNFCNCYALLIDDVNKLGQKISENTHKLKLLKCIQMWSSK